MKCDSSRNRSKSLDHTASPLGETSRWRSWLSRSPSPNGKGDQDCHPIHKDSGDGSIITLESLEDFLEGVGGQSSPLESPVMAVATEEYFGLQQFPMLPFSSADQQTPILPAHSSGLDSSVRSADQEDTSQNSSKLGLSFRRRSASSHSSFSRLDQSAFSGATSTFTSHISARHRAKSARSSPSSRRSWREFSGRSYGDEGYQRGDKRRGVWLAVVTSVVGAEAISLKDLEPIAADGKMCGRPRRGIRSWSRPFAQLDLGKSLGVSSSASLSFGMPEESLLGEGQYGVVWRAQSRLTKKVYAVKSLKTGSRDEGLAAREVEAAEYVRDEPHPCLVQLFGVFESRDSNILILARAFSLVMEFCPGGDLQQKIVEARQSASEDHQDYAAPRLACRWLAQIFLGLEHVHLHIELLFRDLKPGNVVFDALGSAKITDFGLSRRGLKSSGAWTFGFPTGSPGYTAPEIIEQEEYDYRADLYSFGALAWVLLTGGVADREEPTPPINGLEDEWRLMADCLSHNVEALPALALDLVRKLTCRQPLERLEHRTVRTHAFFVPQALPPPISRRGGQLVLDTSVGLSSSASNDLARKVVLAWLQQGTDEQQP